MTYDEFLDWADEDTLAEWVDGMVEMASPANMRHQMVAAFIFRVLARYVEVSQLGLVLQAPFQQHLRKARSGREPDVLFVARGHLDRLQPADKPTHVEGPADLVVEVVAPESVKRDREKKFGEYQRGGVPEYWIIDPDARQADFFQLDELRVYQNVAPDSGGMYHSREVAGLWLAVAPLWHDPLPDVERTVREIAPDAYLEDLAGNLDETAIQGLLDRLQGRGKLPRTGE
jgi:Uma2 family endonuclease